MTRFVCPRGIVSEIKPLRLPSALLLIVVLAAAGASQLQTGASGAESTATGAEPVAKTAKRKRLARNLDIPWGIDFLPSGAALITERFSARILRVPRNGGKARRVMRVPGVDRNAGEGGLLGLAISPRYRKNKLVYAYLTTRRDNRIVRFRLGRKPKVVLKGINRGTIHDGGQLAFGPDGLLYASTGDAGNAGNAQERRSLNGKILRIKPNGRVPKSNPFRGSPIYSYGHRNVQGLAFDRKGRLWASELGQDFRDEVNLIRRGNNYGWPIVEGRGGTQGGKFTNPKVTWPPAKASPSGATIRGKTLYVAALRGERLWKIPLKGNKTGRKKARLKGRYGRLRTVAVAPDRSLWIMTSNGGGNDRIIRLGGGRR